MLRPPCGTMYCRWLMVPAEHQVWETKGPGEIHKVYVTRAGQTSVSFHNVHRWWKSQTMTVEKFLAEFKLWAPRSPHGYAHPHRDDIETLHPMDRKLLNNLHTRSMALYGGKATDLDVDFKARPSENIKALRNAVTDIRDVVGQLQRMDSVMDERLDYVHGTLQALVIALYHTIEQTEADRREQDDR